MTCNFTSFSTVFHLKNFTTKLPIGIDDLLFYVLISLTSGRWKGDNEFVVVVVLLFYVHGKHLRSCWDGQLP